MTASRDFPILRSPQERTLYPTARRSVPWEWVVPHEAQARHNHDQSLKRLAERGGLSPGELLCAVHGQSLRAIMRSESLSCPGGLSLVMTICLF